MQSKIPKFIGSQERGGAHSRLTKPSTKLLNCDNSELFFQHIVQQNKEQVQVQFIVNKIVRCKHCNILSHTMWSFHDWSELHIMKASAIGSLVNKQPWHTRPGARARPAECEI